MKDTSHLVDGKYGITDLVDIEELRRIFERFTKATGFTIGFLDYPGLNVLIATGWRDICTRFHRKCPASMANCTQSNRFLMDQLTEPGKLVVDQCENGLVDCAFPIIIKGTHIASLATGQLLIDTPDRGRFQKQARQFGFDEKAYMQALDDVPVLSEDQLRSMTQFLGEMALVLSQLGYARLEAKEDAARLKKEIASRKKTERALAAEREQLLVTLRSIGDGVITTDTHGRIMLMNQVAEELTGWELAESRGRPLHEVFHIIHEKTRKPCENPVDRILHSGLTTSFPTHTVLVCRNGRERLVADSGAAIRDHSSNILGMVLVFRDETGRIKSEAALQNAQKLQSLGVLAGGIAHDFNNYLGGILGHVELALDSVQDGDSAQAVEELSQISGIFDRTTSLTQRLLTFAKGEMPLLKAGFISDVVQEIAEFSTSGSTVALDFQAKEDVPPCSFDANQIAQVIQNLVLNAKQAMPRGGTVHITVESAHMDESTTLMPAGIYVKITVRDEGTGIPAELMSHIFDPFFSTKTNGNGLGLAICYSIIQKHRGDMDATSQPGEGSEFHLYLPSVDPDHTKTDEIPATRLHEGQGAALVMDDEEFMRSVTSRMLTRMGYDVTTAQDGAEVLKLMEQHPYRLALLDLTIPGGMGGIETAHNLREQQHPDLAILAMSGYSQAQVITNPEDFGFDASIAKPFPTAALAALLNQIMSPTS
jgi:PAS domain S-box-containing protein